MYLEDPEKRATYEELFYQLQTEFRSKDFKELTREEVLDSVDRLESSKFDA